MPKKNAQVAQSGSGNTSTDPRIRRWCFTLNNWLDNELKSIENFFAQKHAMFCIGKEIGDENQTPHLQGYVEFKNGLTFTTLKKLNDRIHWEKAMGNRASNMKYCTKGENYITNIKDRRTEILKKYNGVKWKTWQQKAIDICNSESEPRKIHWFYDPVGNSGKTFLCKYLYNQFKAIICTGKAGDIFNQCVQFQEIKKDDPEIILVDVPRTTNQFINYTAIEKLKDGLFYSGKYEGGVVQFVDNPHVLVFSNELPNFENMSEDRWEIYYIQDIEMENIGAH